MPIGVFVTMWAKPGAEEELFARVQDVMADVRTEPGNLFSVVLRDPSDPSKLNVFEVYRDQAAIDAHREAEHTKVKTPIVRALYGKTFEAKFLETVDWDAAKAAV